MQIDDVQLYVCMHVDALVLCYVDLTQFYAQKRNSQNNNKRLWQQNGLVRATPAMNEQNGAFCFRNFFAANNSLLSSRCAAFVAIHFIAFLTFILYSLLLFFFRFRSRVGISFVNFIKIARASCQKQSKTTDTPTPTRLAVDLNMPQPLYFCCFTAFFGKICHGLCP